MLEEFTIYTDLFGVVLAAKYGLPGALDVQDIIIVRVAEFEERKIFVHPAMETDRERYYLDFHARHPGSTNEAVQLI